MSTFIAHLTQFLGPDGRKVPVNTDLPIEVEPLYKDMLAHGCSLECEALSTGEISVTVSGGDMDIDFSITANDASVHEGIIAMLQRKSWINKLTEKESL